MLSCVAMKMLSNICYIMLRRIKKTSILGHSAIGCICLQIPASELAIYSALVYKGFIWPMWQFRQWPTLRLWHRARGTSTWVVLVDCTETNKCLKILYLQSIFKTFRSFTEFLYILESGIQHIGLIEYKSKRMRWLVKSQLFHLDLFWDCEGGGE